MWENEFGDAERAAVERDGRVTIPSEYDESGYVITRDLLQDAERHVLLDRPIALKCPVRLLHGMQDAAVPWDTSLRVAERLEAEDVEVTLVRGGDHRLSESVDLDRMTQTLDRLVAAVT